MGSHGPLHCILPPEILRKLAGHEQEHVRRAALETLALDTRFRLARAEAAAARRGAARPVTFARIGGSPQRMIYDQDHGTSQTPGQMVRGEGQDATSDPSVNQAYDGLGATYQYYWTRYMRDSIDGQGMPLLGCVHFGSNYDNAFWDNAGHMFFGDGDGVLLTDTTAGIDVIGHELTHGVTQHEANLEYSGQSGALNESISDVFGIQVKQMALGQTAADSDWLIGGDIVGPELKDALRSMKSPGTATGTTTSRATWTATSTAATCTRIRAFPTAHSPSPRRRSAATRGTPPGRSGTRRCATPTCRRRPPSRTSRGSPSSTPDRCTAPEARKNRPSRQAGRR